MKTSTGLLPFRRRAILEVLIAHPGGPFWTRRNEGAWSIVKGEIEGDEDPVTAAVREFREETGWDIPPDPEFIDLGSTKLKSGKLIRCWGLAADFDPATLQPGTFELTVRGRKLIVPEIDRVEWVERDAAAVMLNAAQVVFVDRLVEKLVD
jgi:predicted NUDIX family NTP pyrophosphohydrolase